MKNFYPKLLAILLIFNPLFLEKATADPNQGQLVGESIRAIVGVNIYNLQFYVSDLESFDKNNPLESLKNQEFAQMKIDVVVIFPFIDVSQKRLHKNLQLAFERNEVDMTSPVIRDLFDYLNVDFKKGDSLSFNASRQGQQEIIEVVASNKEETLILSQKNIISDIFSIWLGNTVGDNGMTKLKAGILN